MKTLLEIVNLSSEYLEKQGVKNSRRDALELISFGLEVRPLDLYVQFDRPMTEKELDECRQLLKRKAKGEPIQYIRGEVEFFDCAIKVTPDVLIPRHETEILVDRIATILAQDDLQGKTLLDLCCGSGCIGIALKKRFPELNVILSDLSGPALAVARDNAKHNGVEVTFLQGDFFDAIKGERGHYLVCNPPYVSESEFVGLEVEVRQFEPTMALVAEDNGLAFYKRLERDFLSFLLPKGKMWLEMGSQQGPAVTQIFQGVSAKKMEVQQDWAGHDRFFFLELE